MLAGDIGQLLAGDVTDSAIDVAVVYLDSTGGCDAVRALRATGPDVVIAAHSRSPQRSRWEAAEHAGADLVVNTGALIRTLQALLEQLGTADARKKRHPLFDVGEIPGRLGLILAVDDTPVGPVAVFNNGGELAAVSDRCPHAGGSLSGGRYENGVITCPSHGSQFDVSTGARLRGPADEHVKCYSVVCDAGRVWLIWA